METCFAYANKIKLYTRKSYVIRMVRIYLLKVYVDPLAKLARFTKQNLHKKKTI